MRKIKKLEAENELLKKHIKELTDIHSILVTISDKMVDMDSTMLDMKTHIEKLNETKEKPKVKTKSAVIIPIREIGDDGEVIMHYKTPEQLGKR